MVVVNIESKDHLGKELTDENRKDGLFVLDFHASWCGPCKQIAPAYERLSNEYPNVRFLKINVDDNEDVASDYSVRTLPTFIFLRGNKQLERVMGANQDALATKLRQLTTSDPNDPSSAATISSHKQPDLMGLLSLAQCECLNEANSHPLSSILTGGDGEGVDKYLLSDTDAQLIIFVTFSQFVKLRSLQISGPTENGPKTVKIFVNQISTPDFDGCEAGEAVQTFELKESDLAEDSVLPLNFVRFQKVTSLTLFVKDNQSNTEQTRIDKLRFFGSPVNTTNMQNFARVAGQKGEDHGA